MPSMGCQKLTYQNTETSLKVLYKKRLLNEKVVQLWLSVDPLSDKYPSTSPYMYCLGNPIIFVDPNGMNHDWYASTENGDDAVWLPSDSEAARVFGEGKYVNVGATMGAEGCVTSDGSKVPESNNSIPSYLPVAQEEYGQKDSEHADQSTENPRVMDYHATTTNGSTGVPCVSDEDAWCASFANWSLEQAGFEGNDNAYSANAWSYRYNSNVTEIDKPALGAIAVINNSHVTFVIGINGKNVHGYGGNQGNQVKVSTYVNPSSVRYFMPNGVTPNYNVPTLKINFNKKSNESTR